MKRYGKLLLNKKTKVNSILKIKKKIKKIALNVPLRLNYNFFETYFYIPSCWDFLILKIKNKKIIFFYSLVYFFHLPNLQVFSLIKFNPNNKIFFFKSQFISSKICLFWKLFKLIFYSFSLVYFKKLKFKGKGYYIYKNKRNTIALQFGFSHIKRLFFFFTSVKFLSKTSIIVFGLNPNLITKASFKLRNIRYINIFTGKGIRFNKQIIYRKQGKISSYR